MLNIYSNSKNFHLNSHTTCTTHIPYVLHINIQVGRVSGQPGLVVGNAACGRGVETRWSLRSFSTQAILWFYDSMNLWLDGQVECRRWKLTSALLDNLSVVSALWQLSFKCQLLPPGISPFIQNSQQLVPKTPMPQSKIWILKSMNKVSSYFH